MIRLTSAGILIHCVHLDGQSLKLQREGGDNETGVYHRAYQRMQTYLSEIDFAFYNQYLNFCPWIMF